MATRSKDAASNGRGRANGGDSGKRKWSVVGSDGRQRSHSATGVPWADEQGRRKWTRLLLRELYDLGFEQSAASLEREAGVRLRSPAMERLERLVHEQRWDEAIAFVQRAGAEGLASGQDDDCGQEGMVDEQNVAHKPDGDKKELVVRMRSAGATNAVTLLLLKRKFVGLLQSRELSAALRTFQDEIMSKFELSEPEVQDLAILLLCKGDDDMKKLVTMPIEPSELLGQIEALVSADDVIPPGALRSVIRWDSYDHTWKLATSPEHFERIVRDERSIGERTARQLCIQMLKLCKNLPYSPITWMYLALLGIISAAYGLLVDGWVQQMFKLRRFIVNSAGESLWGFILWTGWCVTVCLIATSLGHWSPPSDGSGIPRMRALFAGVYQNPIDVLSLKTFIAKSLGTVISSGSGLSVGRAGPYTHIVAVIAFHMSRLGLFRRAHFGPENYNYLRAAVACGVTASFGSPLGGVLFSIEVTAKAYDIKYLWEGVISSSICILMYKIITFLKHDVLFERTTFPSFDMDWDLLAFVLLGVVTGV
ncbi:hypothetical protein ATCC90586_011953 [Pythium insidiosum]|nr:hypothetical protein ATCC90586_011953 [Pythium insidiosum]